MCQLFMSRSASEPAPCNTRCTEASSGLLSNKCLAVQNVEGVREEQVSGTLTTLNCF